MIIWIESNHPGCVYISGRDMYDWSDYNGYAPHEISWDFAADLISSHDPDMDGPWALSVCEPLPAECVAEMAQARAWRAANANL
jgi:hypothetical protein